MVKEGKTMKLSIVVPVHNENENLRPLIQEIEAAVVGLGQHEIVYVDDGSSDDTLSRLVSLKSSFPALRVLHHLRCCGQSTSLRTGIKAATGEVIVTLDGDGQNDPANIPAMLEAWRELKHTDHGRGALIAGYRRNRKDTGWRKFSSRFANRIRAALLGDRYSWNCLILTICTAFYQRWLSEQGLRLSQSRSTIGPGRWASPNMALGIVFGWVSGISWA
jgi:dolichol-phosphate mannosyltransferase